jgi:hypothetical protein
MFEKKHEPLAIKDKLYSRLLKSTWFTFLILSTWLCVGMVGYHYTCNYSWIDALLNASMIMSGMGQVNSILTNIGKIFASFYAIISGVVFITSVGVFLAPLVHRFMHQFHLPED